MGSRRERKENLLVEFLDQVLLEDFYHYTFLLLHNLNKAFIIFASLSRVFENF